MHNVLLYGMMEEIREMLKDKIGTCLEVETNVKGRCIRHYMHIRVQLDVAKPFLRRTKIQLRKDLGIIWPNFKYECLPDFCFIGGKISHL